MTVTSPVDQSDASAAVTIQKQRTASFNAPTPVNTPATAAPITSSSFIRQFTNMANTNNGNLDMTALLQQNPEMMQHLMQSLVGQSSGYIENLPEPIQKRIRALKNLQWQQNALDLEYRKEELALQKKYLNLKAPLYSKRKDIVLGDYEPTAEESTLEEEHEHGEHCQHGHQEEPKAADASAASNEQQPQVDIKGVPEFWLTCMKNAPPLETLLQETDDAALKYLTDIQVSLLDNQPGFQLSFHFADNEFFSNKFLTKTYYQSDEDPQINEVAFDRAEGTKIEWKPNRNLSVKVELKKQRHKASNKTRTVKKTIPAETFFNFFVPLELPEDEEELDDEAYEHLQQQFEMDYELGVFFKEELVPNAVHWFTGEAAAAYEDDEEEDEEDDYDEDEEEDDEDDNEEEEEEEAEAQPAAGQQPAPECKQQ